MGASTAAAAADQARIEPRLAMVNCPPTGRRAADASKRLIHYQYLDVTVPRMRESARHAADHVEPQRLPQPYRALVGADDEIELHAAIAARAGLLERMRAHRPSDAAPAR